MMHMDVSVFVPSVMAYLKKYATVLPTYLSDLKGLVSKRMPRRQDIAVKQSAQGQSVL
jgi:hypothetical protein